MKQQIKINQQIKNSLYQHLCQIVRERDPYLGSAGHYYVKEYIRQELAKFGEVRTHPFNLKGKIYENLILDLCDDQGLMNAYPILIGAHYDTVPGSPGADDNATGVSVLLELAKFFTQEPPRLPVRLVAFDLEEYGLLGSKAYSHLLSKEKQKLRLMLSLEMLGYYDNQRGSQSYPPVLKYFYPSRGNFLALIGNARTIPDLVRISKSIKQANVACEWLPMILRGNALPETRRSDHAPFWDHGYNAIMVTDTANLRNPNYHKAKDTIDTINLDFLTKVCQGLALAIKVL